MIDYHPDIGDFIGAIGILHILPGAYIYISGAKNNIIEAKVFAKTIGIASITIGFVCVIFSGIMKTNNINNSFYTITGLTIVGVYWLLAWTVAVLYLKRRGSNIK